MNQDNLVPILNDISNKIVELKNELIINNDFNKYQSLINKIKSNKKLKNLFDGDNECENHIHKCIAISINYPFLKEYINLYFKFNPNKINLQCRKNLKTPIMTACSIFCFDEEIVKIILKYSPNLELKDIKGNTVLYRAFFAYDFLKINKNIIKLLIDAGVNVNNTLFEPEKKTILHKICNLKNILDIDLYELLLKAGADPNQKDFKSKTPLDYLLFNNNDNIYPIIDLFCKYNYNFNSDNINTIGYAIKYNNYNNLKAILSKYDNLDIIINNVKLINFNYVPQKLIKILKYLDYDNEIINLAISKGVKIDK